MPNTPMSTQILKQLRPLFGGTDHFYKYVAVRSYDECWLLGRKFGVDKVSISGIVRHKFWKEDNGTPNS